MAGTGKRVEHAIHRIFQMLTCLTGMTETSTVVSSTSEHDVFPGSSGSLLPGVRAKIIGFDGKEVNDYGHPGELVLQSPSVVLGYLNHEKANAETFVWDDEGRWIKTGDEAMILKAPSGNEHVFILDRIKELIKVKVGPEKQFRQTGHMGARRLSLRPSESDWEVSC